jgi:hypothetical protein
MVKPVFESLSATNYNKAFFLGSLVTSLTSLFALRYSAIAKERFKMTHNCKDNRNMFCSINRNNFLTKIELLMQTVTSTIIIYYILFFLFGYGGGNLNLYYKPNYQDFIDFLKMLFYLLLFNYLFYFFTVVFHKKKIPNLFGVLYAIYIQYGFTHNLRFKDRNKRK